MAFRLCCSNPLGAKFSSGAAFFSAVPCPATCHDAHNVDSSYAALLRLANCQNWITQLRAHAHAAWNRSERHQSLLKTGSWSTSHTRLAFPDILQERGPATALHATGGVYVGSLPSDGPCQKALNMRRRTILTPSAWRATVVQGP